MRKDTISFDKDMRSGQKKSREVAPKIKPVPGYLMAQYKRCGRANCKCSRGLLHGPYFYHVWNIASYRYKRYVKKSDLAAVRACIQEHRRRRAEIKAFNEEAMSEWKKLKDNIREINAFLR